MLNWVLLSPFRRLWAAFLIVGIEAVLRIFLLRGFFEEEIG